MSAPGRPTSGPSTRVLVAGRSLGGPGLGGGGEGVVDVLVGLGDGVCSGVSLSSTGVGVLGSPVGGGSVDGVPGGGVGSLSQMCCAVSC